MNQPAASALAGRLLAAWILCLVLAGCTPPPELEPLAADAVVLAFGDSLTFGTGAGPGESYPEVLSGLIGRTVVNAGVPGEVSTDGLLRLPALLDREQPALLLLCHGGNDQLQRLDPNQLADNLRAMIRSARDRGIAVALIAVPAPGLTLAPPPAPPADPARFRSAARPRRPPRGSRPRRHRHQTQRRTCRRFYRTTVTSVFRARFSAVGADFRAQIARL